MDLEALILERARLRERGDSKAAEYDRPIELAGAELGLSSGDVDALAAHLRAEGEGNPLVAIPGARHSAPGEYVIHDLERGILPGIMALLAFIVWAMGQPWVALGLLLLAVLGFVLPKRVRRFTVDANGGLHLHSSASPAFDWQRLRHVRVKRREPRWGTAITRAARARLEVLLVPDEGDGIRFATGLYFQRAPVRRPVDLVHVGRYLEHQCRQCGMNVTSTEHGFTAERG